MAKTDLTLEIEEQLKTYAPAEMGGFTIYKARGCHLAYEVPVVCGTTNGGLIDAVEIAEGYRLNPSRKTCLWSYVGKKDRRFHEKDNLCKRGYSEPLLGCNEPGCKWTRTEFPRTEFVLAICYEIKISKNDFASKNGHNFMGNLNYYVMPLQLYHQVKEKIPEEVGVICYSEASELQKMRRKKDSTYIDIGCEAQKWLILSVMKKRAYMVCK
jgi:hypothetical protein